MATYYLDWNSGSANNANAGTSEASPWKDLGAVTSRTFVPNDIIYLKAGTYVESTERRIWAELGSGEGTAGNPILLAAYPGHEGAVTVTRTGTPSTYSNIVGVWLAASYWHIRGLELRRRLYLSGLRTGNVVSYNDINGQDYPSMPNDLTGSTTLRPGLALGGTGLINCHVHHNIIRNWHAQNASIFNTTCVIVYTYPDAARNYLIEDNWFQGSPNAGYEKDSALGNIWQRNKIDGGWRGNNQNANSETLRYAQYEFRHNVMNGAWPNILQFTDGAKYYNNYFQGGKFERIGSNQTVLNTEIYNNIIIPGHSSSEVWESKFMTYYAALWAYYDHNVYAVANPLYEISGASQSLSFMTSRGFEQNIATGVALADVYTSGWALKAPYTTAGRNGGKVGPLDASGNPCVALILDTSRYGPTAFDPGSPSNMPPTASLSITNITNLTVDTDNTGSVDSDGTIAARSTNWGDGTAPSTGTAPSHTYASAGTYNVTLTITDDDGATDQDTEQVTVGSPPYVQTGSKRVRPSRRMMAGGWR